MFKKIVIALALASVSVPALAAEGDSGFGVEGGLGIADTKDYAAALGQSLANATGRTTTYTYDESALAFRMYGFYSITDQIDAEIGYFRTGSIDIKYSFSGTSATASTGFEADGFDYGVRFKPSDDWFLRVGMHTFDLTQTVSVTISGTTYSASATADDTGAYFGGGYNFDEHWNVGYTLYSDVGGDAGGDVGFLYAGYRF